MGETFNVYITGVGGQGIGLLAEALARAADRAGLPVRGCDTHGLAQRGGIVSSFVRIGPDGGSGAHSPLVREGCADLVLALERCEALRAAREWLAPGGSLVYYDTSWQPLPVRLGEEAAVEAAEVEATCAALGAKAYRIPAERLPDPRMQNAITLGKVAREGLVPGLSMQHYQAAFEDLMEGAGLAENLALLLGGY
jgi:indolepyruvate ferredoxin oxidoreductase beta subunit